AAIGEGAGIGFGAVYAVGVGGERGDAVEPVDGEGEGEQEFAVAAAAPPAAVGARADGDGGLAARKQDGGTGEGAVAGGDLAGEGGMDAPDLARLALDGVGQDGGRDAGGARGFGGSFERDGCRGDGGNGI